ncbi:MAG: AGE family epimerase/isomerase [Micavibrio aeruginosavorus]|uniref:AGE family epimerase/isomerase n=1 Tax=Micavibrio aeruginosavorus TaxID=349221 RepID=A0A7T5R485_9BACT|nr:MAG: AGE family epimerase/isomerase [Micavibrio aeruginosavorus]
MNHSTHTNVEYLAQRLLQRWVIKWYEAFPDPATGGFYERLGKGFKPRYVGNRRLLTQCRQLAMYSHASLHGPQNFRPDLKKHFDALLEKYYVPETGGWRFSLGDNGRPADNTYDLYSLTFVIFGFSHYFRATQDERARNHARAVLDFIENHFTLPGKPGYAEALDEQLHPINRTRRQNPHMHLLEACLFAEETWGDPAYARMSDRLVHLFMTHFYKPEQNHLCEFFTEDLSPDPTTGQRVEPGHYFEWVWLLKKHAALRCDPARHDGICLGLLHWANRFGWDQVYGGIFDVLNPAGLVLTDTKRIWPFAEALKANALMIDMAPDRDAIKARMAEMVRVFRECYMQERGFWVEWLNRDLSPATDYMPGTTPYHVYFGIMETRAVIHARGETVSLRSGMGVRVYTWRRALSNNFRKVKKKIRA